MHSFIHGAQPAAWRVETIKGLVYVAVTGLLLYLFVKARETEYYAARRTTENRLRRLTESNLISICYWKPTGEVTDANDAFLKLLGYSRAELLNRKLNWRNFTPPEYFAIDSENLKRLLMTGLQVNYEKEFLRKDRTRVPVLVGAAMIDSSHARGVAYVLDMTELKKAQERSAELEQQLRQSQKLEAIGQLVSGIAHDFNNLLNVIIGYTCLLDAKVDPDETLGQQTKSILKAAQKASDLIRKLLAFARKQVLNPEYLDINTTLREYEHLMPRLIGEKIHLDLKLAAPLWPVEVDRSQLEQVIINLVVNARDAMPNGGMLTITTSNDDEAGQVLLTVHDTGIGMNQETKARIFDPFFTTKPEGQGTGLGLSTVYGIVAQSSGRIAVSSEVGHGTTFEIRLPRAKQSQERSGRGRMTIHSMSAPGRTNETVLLVEDEPDLRELLSSLLRMNGYHVIAARDGQEAVELAKAHAGPVELLLTDIVMPHMNGLEAARIIRGLRPNISVIFMTGYAEEALSMSRSLGNDALLEKPVSPPILFEQIRKLLDAGGKKRVA
jgi:PAS domain S-box-containing protein